MTAPTIATVFDPPLPSDSKATFNTKAFGLVSGLNTWSGEANAQAAYLNAMSASVAAFDALANFQGAWSALSGALAMPATVSHGGNIYALTANVADVTAHTPGVSASWQLVRANSAQITHGAGTVADDLNSSIGMVGLFPRSTAPTGWLKANGAAISRTTYAALFSVVGTTFGTGDGSTTFNLPDLRGEFIRGLDDGRGVDAARVMGSAQGDAIRNITGSYAGSSGAYGEYSGGVGAFYNSGGSTKIDPGSWTSGNGIGFDASRQVPTASENRPRNVALLACIKY